MNVRELRAALADPSLSGDLSVIIKWDEIDGLETIVMDPVLATKQGETFRIYLDPKSERRYV